MRIMKSIATVLASLAFFIPSLNLQAQQAMQEPTLRIIESNGIKLRIAEMGKGPLVILVHGWPESWYSWRHQMPALAAAGYHVVAPDMRGYGKSDRPHDVESYSIQKVTADIVGIVDALGKETGEKTAMLVGHDWGSIVTWHAMLLHPQRFTALVAMSVPYAGHGEQSLITSLRKAMGDNFYYILYFQEPGVAEKEFDADPRGILSRLYLSPDSPREAPTITDPKRAAGGMIGRYGAPKGLPAWLTQSDLDYYVNEFAQAGFRGGINYYRNFHPNWESTPQLADAKVTAPVYFIAGEKDVVIRGATADGLKSLMKNAVPDLRGVTLIPNTGHWVQQEKPAETNAAMIQFFQSVTPGKK
jgi:pimeloyl-ACP methyl ester carboxylesterase